MLNFIFEKAGKLWYGSKAEHNIKHSLHYSMGSEGGFYTGLLQEGIESGDLTISAEALSRFIEMNSSDILQDSLEKSLRECSGNMKSRVYFIKQTELLTKDVEFARDHLKTLDQSRELDIDHDDLSPV